MTEEEILKRLVGEFGEEDKDIKIVFCGDEKLMDEQFEKRNSIYDIACKFQKLYDEGDKETINKLYSPFAQRYFTKRLLHMRKFTRSEISHEEYSEWFEFEG